MNKCPQCLNVLTKSDGVCPKCGYSFAEDVKETLSILADETQAIRILEYTTMTPEKWEKVKELFLEAEKLTQDKREKFLEIECGNDNELRQEVENLLNSSKDDGDSFLEDTAIGEAPSLFDEKTRFKDSKTQDQIHITTSDPNKLIEGSILDDRYRILGLLGRGGMGEVYKAEDIKLDQTVALKFLPEKLSKNEDALRRFVGEVKIARQVAHENVCKVFDIGEVGGKSYLSMEFIEGDDLSQLLKRIGRLPSDKALEISRQICMGLNAIHKTGILHRDLKPANIIIDSKGKARITDFGIAGFEADVQGNEARVGTPAYMSPEQISGKEVTQKSDIYSLGLLLYEIFTGKQAFEADTIPELLEKQQTDTPTTLSEIITSIDPLTETIITQCLEKDPIYRPESALQVAMRLPGGNPLEVALEAGETPTPEMIAAAPAKGALNPLVALVLLLVFISGFSLVMYWSSIYGISSYVPLEDSPEVLAKKAQTIINNLGFTEAPRDRYYQFEYDSSYLEYAKEQKNPREAWEKVRTGQPLVLYFRYRQSPKYLTPTNNFDYISENNPPLMEPGMINVELDTKGRLTKFTAVPDLDIQTTENPQKTDWKKLFDEAGLDMANFKEIDARQRPTVFADEITGFKGTLADFADIPIRIEAAGYQGKPVYFNIIPTWKEAGSKTQKKVEESSQWSLFLIIFYSLFTLALFGSFLLARYNMKKGRGNLKGATRLAVFFFVVSFLSGAVKFYGNTSLPTVEDKFGLFFESAGYVLLFSFFIFVAYLAIEPFFRRRLSDMFISWNRLMMGDFRNPMIGRDILVGLTVNVGFDILYYGLPILKSYSNNEWINDIFFKDFSLQLSSISGSLIIIPLSLIEEMIYAFFYIFLVLIFSLVFKKKWISVLAMVLLIGGLVTFRDILTQEWLSALSLGIAWVALFFIILRYGLVALISLGLAEVVCSDSLITFDTSSFYFPGTVLIMATMFAIAIYAFYISTDGKSIFKKEFFEGN